MTSQRRYKIHDLELQSLSRILRRCFFEECLLSVELVNHMFFVLPCVGSFMYPDIDTR